MIHDNLAKEGLIKNNYLWGMFLANLLSLMASDRQFQKPCPKK